MILVHFSKMTRDIKLCFANNSHEPPLHKTILKRPYLKIVFIVSFQLIFIRKNLLEPVYYLFMIDRDCRLSGWSKFTTKTSVSGPIDNWCQLTFTLLFVKQFWPLHWLGNLPVKENKHPLSVFSVLFKGCTYIFGQQRPIAKYPVQGTFSSLSIFFRHIE